jgi:pSer/pThr/pTyr-binding forkhead associated (FHA) protein
MWILQSEDDEAERVTFRMPLNAVRTIGRSAGAQFIVEASLVSRLHCQLAASSDSLQVKDLGSTNGTYVNGKRVRAARLEEGDRLGVGRVTLVIGRDQQTT